jgi:hypothetical protein
MNLLFLFPHLFGFGFILYFLASIAESAPIVAPEAEPVYKASGFRS